MAYEFQVTVDCADPHALADWWAETLGWQVEPQDEAFIRQMINAGYATDSARPPPGTSGAPRFPGARPFPRPSSSSPADTFPSLLWFPHIGRARLG